jgi:hypothetical protein
MRLRRLELANFSGVDRLERWERDEARVLDDSPSPPATGEESETVGLVREDGWKRV